MDRDWIIWGIPVLGALLAFALACRRVLDNPRQQVAAGLALLLMRAYVRFFHRLRVRGLENVPRSRTPGPLVVVGNHTAGIDPILIQIVCPFEVRWMMANDMQPSLFRALWNWMGVISVDPSGSDSTAAREALRHLRAGGVLGIFPEAGIERPPRRLKPFHSGLGLLVTRTGAKVLPVVIEGTPLAATAWGSLYRPSHSRITFLPLIDYTGSGLKPAQIAQDVRRRFIEHTGWPAE